MYLMLLGAAALLAVCFVINKIYQKHAGTTLKAGLTFNSLRIFCSNNILLYRRIKIRDNRFFADYGNRYDRRGYGLYALRLQNT